jgi:hypothetical protein
MPNSRLPSGNWVKQELFNAPLAEERLSSYGKLLYFVTGLTTYPPGTVIGDIVMHYDITLILPQPAAPIIVQEANLDRLVASETLTDVGTGNGAFSSTAAVGQGSVLGVYDGATPSSARPGGIFTFRTDKQDQGVTLTDMAGKAIADGTRLFYSVADTDVDDFNGPANNNYCSKLSTDRTLSENSRVLISSVIAGSFLPLLTPKRVFFR